MASGRATSWTCTCHPERGARAARSQTTRQPGGRLWRCSATVASGPAVRAPRPCRLADPRYWARLRRHVCASAYHMCANRRTVHQMLRCKPAHIYMGLCASGRMPCMCWYALQCTLLLPAWPAAAFTTCHACLPATLHASSCSTERCLPWALRHVASCPSMGRKTAFASAREQSHMRWECFSGLRLIPNPEARACGLRMAASARREVALCADGRAPGAGRRARGRAALHALPSGAPSRTAPPCLV